MEPMRIQNLRGDTIKPGKDGNRSMHGALLRPDRLDAVHGALGWLKRNLSERQERGDVYLPLRSVEKFLASISLNSPSDILPSTEREKEKYLENFNTLLKENGLEPLIISESKEGPLPIVGMLAEKTIELFGAVKSKVSTIGATAEYDDQIRALKLRIAARHTPTLASRER